MSFGLFLIISDTSWRQRLKKFFKSLLKLDLEAIHLFLTWLWIFAGCLFQFFTVCRHIRRQGYIPSTWKYLVIISSAFLLGPTAIYSFGICLIVSFKLRLQEAPKTTSELSQILKQASIFASRARLGEIFFESIPQFLTQILMTSGKGEAGIRELTLVQKVSVITSTVAIAFGVSKFGVRDTGIYLSKYHSRFASYLVLNIFALSEIAFCGGLCRFSFALKVGETNAVVILIPFVALSSVVSMAPFVSNRFQFRYGGYFFLASKLFIWVTIVGIFFAQGSYDDRLNALQYNNSLITFFVTMTVTAMINFTLGFLIHRYQTNFKGYKWVDTILEKMAESMTEHILPELEGDKAYNHISWKLEQKNFTCPNRLGEENLKPKQMSNKMASRKAAHKRHCSMASLTWTMVISYISLLIVLIIGLFSYPLPNFEEGYYVQFHFDCFKEKSNSTGFPVVSATNDSHRGSICVNDKSPLQMFNIGKVIAKQIHNESKPESMLFVGNLSYDGHFSKENVGILKKPFLQPSCNGNERNLIYCEHYGLNVGLSKNCKIGTNRFYLSVVEKAEVFSGCNYAYIIEEMSFNASEKFCQDMDSKDFYSSRIVYEKEGKVLYQHIPNTTMVKGIWLGNGGYLNLTTDEPTVVLPQNVQNEILPSICLVSLEGMVKIFLEF